MRINRYNYEVTKLAKTLEELKQENAELENESNVDPQSTEEENTNDVVENEPEGDQVAESENEEGENETELWQQDEQTSNEDQSVPVSKHIKVRTKLKGEIREQKSELEKLRAENAKMQESILHHGKPTQPSARPKIEDFDFDDDEYNKALDKWDDERLTAKVSELQNAGNQQAQFKARQESLEQSVTDHYERASTLIESAGISADVYKEADTAVRLAVDAVMPGKGDEVVNFMISNLGDNSEKLMYYVGRNPQVLEELKATLANDPSGMKTMLYLGRKSVEVTAPKKKASKAPAPATAVSGDANLTGSGSALLKKYNKAGSVQDRIDIKRQAKQAGIKTADW